MTSVLHSMSTSTYSSSAPWPWTSESDFDSDHDLTIVVLHKEIIVRLQEYLSFKGLGECGNHQSPCPGLPDNLCLSYMCHSPRVIQTGEGLGREDLGKMHDVKGRRRWLCAKPDDGGNGKEQVAA